MITLCMIAKNEAAWLLGALQSVHDLVHEMVLVDTGSEDGTPEIARRAGAKVVQVPWRDDFAWARNVALEHATSRWILVLDADERLAPEGVAAIRQAIATNSFGCGLLPIHEATRPDAHVEDVIRGHQRSGEPLLQPRLFLRDDLLRWTGRVHETVRPWLVKTNPVMAVIDAPILHFGTLPGRRAARGTDALHLRLLQRRSTEEPQNPQALTALAQALLRAGHVDPARRALHRAWQTTCEQDRAPLANLTFLHGLLCLKQIGPDAAREIVEVARSRGVDHPNVDFLWGRLHETAQSQHADLLIARDAYLRCLEARGIWTTEAIHAGVTRWRSAWRLGRVLARTGDRPSAERALRAAISDNPRDQRITADLKAVMDTELAIAG
jgi:glycosyltransferase involved in cell wall biosynthesis